MSMRLRPASSGGDTRSIPVKDDGPTRPRNDGGSNLPTPPGETAAPKKKRRSGKYASDHLGPKMGVQGFLWKYILRLLHSWFGWPWLVPAPGVNEQIVNARHQLKQLMLGSNVQPVITQLNQKGGSGKTTDVASSACVIADVSHQAVTVVDNNQTKGTTATRLGVGATLSINRAMEYFARQKNTDGEVPASQSRWRYEFTYADTTNLGHHPAYANVRVVDSPNAQERQRFTLRQEPFRRFVQCLKTTCHTLLIDCGNNFDSQQTVVAVEEADVLRFVAIPWIDNSVQDCHDTMMHFRNDYKEKVDNSVLVISGHRKGDPSRESYAEYFGLEIEQVILIPLDPHLQAMTGKESRKYHLDKQVKVVDPQKFRPRTLLANLRRDIATYTQADRNRQLSNHEAPPPPDNGHAPETTPQHWPRQIERTCDV